MRNYNIFFTSDTHFSHAKALDFLNYDGSRMRPFDTWQEADEKMIENWNKVVRPCDKVYVLGDVFWSRNEADKIMPRLNGKKCLIKGNHDLFKPQWYLLWFYDIRACHNFENFLITHVPVHPDSKARFKRNIHGHTHCNKILLPDGTEDPWYRNVCMDSNNYAPVAYEDIQHEYSVLVQKGLLETPKERNKKMCRVEARDSKCENCSKFSHCNNNDLVCLSKFRELERILDGYEGYGGALDEGRAWADEAMASRKKLKAIEEILNKEDKEWEQNIIL